MYTKIFIKFYIVLFVINIALLGVFGDMGWLLRLALVNSIFLFIILVQERKAFTGDTQGRRILFSRDVFAFLAIGIGIRGAGLYKILGGLFVDYFRWVALLVGLFFYVLSALIFRMYPTGLFRKSVVRRIAVALIVVFFLAMNITLLLGHQGVSYTSDAVDNNLVSIQNRWTGLFGSFGQITDIGEDEGGKGDKIDSIGKVDEGDKIEGIDEGKKIDEEKNRLFGANVDSDRVLTFGNFLPILVKTYDLSAGSEYNNFVYVSKDNDLYPAFATARDYTMIGSATHPDQEILCKHLMVLLGLAEGRKLSYTVDTVFDIYWTEARKRGYLDYGCEEMNQEASFENLP